MRDLPTGWAEARLTDVCDIEMGQSPPSSTYNTDGSGLPFLQGKADFGKLHATPAKFCSRPSKVARAGAILLSVRAPVGPTNITPTECCIGRGLAAISPLGDIPARFVLWALRCHERALAKSGTGSTFAAVSKAQVASIPIVLPPLNEQRRIVERIEALFDEIDRGVQSLYDAKRAIGLYRQSLLKSAFAGRLTADWRAENADKLESTATLLARFREQRQEFYKASLHDWERSLCQWRKEGGKGKRPTKPKAPKRYSSDHSDLQLELPELPHGWAWSHLGCTSRGPEYGTAARSSTQGEIPVVRMGNIQNGRIDWSNLVYTSDQEEIARYSLQPGDVLFNRTNSPELVGKTAIYLGERPALFAGYLVRVNQIDQLASGPYVAHFLNSPLAREHGKSVKTDGVNQSNINGTKLQEYPLPVCSPAEQTEIARILDARLESAEALDNEIDASLARAEALRQTILNKAFSGELVPQDPNDEPAEALLVRIRARRGGDSTTRTRTRGRRHDRVADVP